MVTDIHDRSTAALYRTLVSLFGRLEPIWRESWERVLVLPATTRREQDTWATAAARLEEALVALERFAATVDPTFGHRDWSSRRPRSTAAAAWLPSPRSVSSDGVVVQISS